MKLLNNEGTEIEKIDLGIVKAGETKEYSYIIYNDTPREVVDIVISIENKEVNIKKYPSSLSPNTKETLLLSWSPSIDVKRGLKSLIKITASELYT